MSGKVILLPVRAGTKQTSLCLWRLIINSSKARPMAPIWVFNVTAQNGQGDQTLSAESRLLILPRVPPSLAWGSQDPLRPSAQSLWLNQVMCFMGPLDGGLNCLINLVCFLILFGFSTEESSMCAIETGAKTRLLNVRAGDDCPGSTCDKPAFRTPGRLTLESPYHLKPQADAVVILRAEIHDFIQGRFLLPFYTGKKIITLSISLIL